MELNAIAIKNGMFVYMWVRLRAWTRLGGSAKHLRIEARALGCVGARAEPVMSEVTRDPHVLARPVGWEGGSP